MVKIVNFTQLGMILYVFHDFLELSLVALKMHVISCLNCS